MKKSLFTICALLLSVFAWGEYSMLIHRSEGKVSVANCESVDSVKCLQKSVRFHKEGDDVSDYDYRTLDSITFVDADELIPRDTVFVTFSRSGAKCVNPYESFVDIKTDGGVVNVKSTAYYKDIVYVLSGSSDNGSFVIDSERKFKVILDNLTLTSTGQVSPIRSFSGKTMSIELKGKNVLADSDKDTCNAVIRSKGQIVFEPCNGSLEVNAKQKRAIQSGDYIEVNGGTIKTTSSLDDCIRANDYFLMKDGKLSLTGGGLNITNGYFRMDGGSLQATSEIDKIKMIEVETEFVDEEGDTIANAEHGAFYLNGGEITFTLNGEGARFVKVDGDIVVKGGAIDGSVNGASFLESISTGGSVNDDVTNTTAMKADGTISFLGGVHNLRSGSSADGARLLASDNGIVFDGGVKLTLQSESTMFEYTSSSGKSKSKIAAAVKTDKSVVFKDCEVTINSSSYAYGIASDGNTEVNDGAIVTIVCESNDGVYVCTDCAGRLVCNGGYIASYTKASWAFSCPVTLNGGLAVGFGKVKHASSMKNSKYGLLLDREYDGTPFQVTDEDGNVLVSHTGQVGGKDVTVNQLCIGFQFTQGENFIYKLGGKLKGDAVGSTGFVLNGSYTGGDEFEVVGPGVNKTVSIVRE